jgi:hypothetical protein
MIGRFLKGLPIAAVALALAANAAWAGKANDTLVWTTDREATAADPYYDNIRELVIIGHTVWDGLLFRNLDTGEYEPLLATGYEWIDNTTIDNNHAAYYAGGVLFYGYAGLITGSTISGNMAEEEIGRAHV